MHKIQMNVFKILLILHACIFIHSFSAKAQEMEESLQIGDSLFLARQYTQALRIYDAIFETGEMVAPAMLLKMAYIYEGLEKVPDALYYLNLYYLETNDESALQKMNDLATRHNLSGYDLGGFELITRFYYAFFNQIVLGIAMAILVLFGFMSYNKLVKKKGVSKPAFAMIIFSVLLFYLINFGQRSKMGIIDNSNCYLMSGPSSSSDVIDIVKAGHRVKIIDHKDVWVKIQWGEKTAYTKEKNIKRISIM